MPGVFTLDRPNSRLAQHHQKRARAKISGGYNGNVQQVYFYEPFGQLVFPESPSALPYQFTGREADASGLMYYRARYYNPSWGRFVSRDPLGVGGLADVAALASVRDQVRPDDGMRPGAPGAGDEEGSEAGSPWEQGEPARVLSLGVGAGAAAWMTDVYAYAADNPVDYTDPRGRVSYYHPGGGYAYDPTTGLIYPQGAKIGVFVPPPWMIARAIGYLINRAGSLASRARYAMINAWRRAHGLPEIPTLSGQPYVPGSVPTDTVEPGPTSGGGGGSSGSQPTNGGPPTNGN